MINKLVGKTINISLWIQLLTTGIGFYGLSLNLKPKHQILKSILAIETIEPESIPPLSAHDI